MSAAKILELAEEQGLLEPQVIATLRKQVQAKPNITAQLIARTLTDKGLLTAFQAKKLLTAAHLDQTKPALNETAAAEWAAWYHVAEILLNLDETITKQ